MDKTSLMKGASLLRQTCTLFCAVKYNYTCQAKQTHRPVFKETYISFWTSASSKRRPIRRLVAYNVFWGLVTDWRLAGMPTSLSPSAVKAITEGVVLAPSAFSRTCKENKKTQSSQIRDLLALQQY